MAPPRRHLWDTPGPAPPPLLVCVRPAPSGTMPSRLWPEVFSVLHVSDKISLASRKQGHPGRQFLPPLVGIAQSCLIIVYEFVLLPLCLRSSYPRIRFCEGDLCAGRYWEESFRSAPWGSRGCGVGKQDRVKGEGVCDAV